MNRDDHISTLLEGATWRVSSYSGAQGDCVEIAVGVPVVVPVRDSKRPTGPVLAFSRDAWSVFVERLR